MDLNQLRADLAASADPTMRALARLVDGLIDNPDRVRALLDLADGQLTLERVSDPPELPPYPAPVDGQLVWPIECSRRAMSRARGETPPACTWRRDSCGFSCQQCGRWEGAESGRGGFIARCFMSNGVE